MSATNLGVFNADGQTAYIDYRTEATTGYGRQVVAFGDPAIKNNVAAVASQDLPGSDQTTPAVVFRLAGSATIQQINASVGVFFDRGGPAVKDIAATLVLGDVGGVSSGSAAGVSVSGNTIISPVASRVNKIYAINITTTAQVSLTIRLTNGAGSGPTEYWRYALQAPTQGIAGANIAVSPPAFLFAQAAGSTLALVIDSASLVHYSVSYFRESA